MKKIALISSAALVFLLLGSFTPAPSKIQWLTLEQAFQKIQKEPRKVFIDVYTGWCGWCKVMDKNTFANPKVAEYADAKYYAVKFDAESTADIKLGTSVYKYDAKSKVHQAAIALMKGQMSYPTVVFLDEKFNMIQPLPGYRDAKQFHQILTWFGENNHAKEPFEKYIEGTYQKKYPAGI